jgi:DNA-binding MarR family transcriptional regulator
MQHLSQTYYEVITTFERFMGMSRARWAILRRLSREEDVTQAVLAQSLHVDAAAITRQVKQLEAEGLVTRWPHPADNRFTVVALTTQGRNFVEERRGERDAFHEIVTTGLTLEDVAHMQRCLSHMRHNAEALALKLDTKQ